MLTAPEAWLAAMVLGMKEGSESTSAAGSAIELRIAEASELGSERVPAQTGSLNGTSNHRSHDTDQPEHDSTTRDAGPQAAAIFMVRCKVLAIQAGQGDHGGHIRWRPRACRVRIFVVMLHQTNHDVGHIWRKVSLRPG